MHCASSVRHTAQAERGQNAHSRAVLTYGSIRFVCSFSDKEVYAEEEHTAPAPPPFTGMLNRGRTHGKSVLAFNRGVRLC